MDKKNSAENMYVAIHVFKHGFESYPFKSSLEREDLPDSEALAKAIGVEYFEPEVGDFLEVVHLDPGKTVKIDEALGLGHKAGPRVKPRSHAAGPGM